MATTDGIVTPDYPGANSNVPTATLTMAESLRGRTVRRFASTGDRDTAVQALPTAARQGALVYVAGQGWMGYTKSSDPYDSTNASWYKFQQVKYGYQTGTIEGNGHLRVPSSACFFDGAAPSAIVATWTGPAGYVVEWGMNDGSGCLFRCYNLTTGAQILAPNLGAVFWIAGR